MSQLRLKRPLAWHFDFEEQLPPSCPSFNAVANRFGSMSIQEPKRQCRPTQSADASLRDGDEPVAFLDDKPLFLERFAEDDYEQVSRSVADQAFQGAKRQRGQWTGHTDPDEELRSLIAQHYTEHQQERDEAIHQHYRRVIVELMEEQALFFQRYLRENYEEGYFEDRECSYFS